jgi:hypothetical protein
MLIVMMVSVVGGVWMSRSDEVFVAFATEQGLHFTVLLLTKKICVQRKVIHIIRVELLPILSHVSTSNDDSLDQTSSTVAGADANP